MTKAASEAPKAAKESAQKQCRMRSLGESAFQPSPDSRNDESRVTLSCELMASTRLIVGRVRLLDPHQLRQREVSPAKEGESEPPGPLALPAADDADHGEK